MSDKQAERQETTIGFWRRLALAIDQMGESYEEQLEKRVCRLEVEVSRLSLIQGEAGASGREVGRGPVAILRNDPP